MKALPVIVVSLVVFVYLSGPVSAQAPERITEIRVHGNHTTPDTDILALSGLAPGEEASEARLEAAEERLRGTGRFEEVELRRRYLSITDPSKVLIMIVVDEHPAVSATNLTPGLASKIGAASMYLPILKHTDGYGMTYGVRVAFNDVVGDRSRLSVPLTWGGERRAGADLERSFDGPISFVRGGAAINRRVNPHYERPDLRLGARAEVESVVTDWFRVGAGTRIERVDFGPAYEARHTAGGVHAVFDTRIDPSFPRNAVHARLAWERIGFRPRDGVGAPIGNGSAGQWDADIRGYVGLVGSTVLALRGRLVRSDAPLPAAEQTLLGGSESLRGYRTGHRAGDSMAAASIELRQPLTSPLSVGRFGVKAFVDMGTTWSAGGRLGDQPFERGVGGGIFMGVGPVTMDLDLAKPEQGRVRAHFGLGVTF